MTTVGEAAAATFGTSVASAKVPFLAPTFPSGELVAEDYAAIIASGIFTNGGPMDRKLVAAVEDWVGAGVKALSFCNCTVGIELAVRATFRDAPRGLVPAFTFAAGPLALWSAGYTPEFIDVERSTWQPSLEHARAVLASAGDEVGGILLTSTFGVADEQIAEWEALADRYELPLVIDSAAGFGAEYESGERLGARGTCEIFSMHATKMVAAGEGGLITSRDRDLIEAVGSKKNFGFGSERASTQWGTNAKLQELTAAIGARQLAALPERLMKRRRLQAEYQSALEPLGLAFQPGALKSAPAFVSALLPEDVSRDAVIARLAAAGIESRKYYDPPVHRQPYFAAQLIERQLESTDDLCARVISLPIADDLDTDVITRIADVIRLGASG